MDKSELKGFKIGILLGGGLNNKGRLNEISRKRVRLAYNLLKENLIEQIIVCGKYSSKKKPYTESFLYKNYLLDRGIHTRQVILEPKARNTINAGVFSKEIMIGGRFQKKILLITSDFHIKRAINNFKYIFGNDYIIVGVSCKTPFITKTLKKISEIFKYQTDKRFLKTFMRGDHKKIKEFMKKYED